MHNLIKPKKLSHGDKIAAITLSWGGPGTFPYRYEIGRQRLETVFGLEVVPTPHALRDADWIYRNPEARADDLMGAFLDPTIKGVFSSIGGDDSIRLLPYIDTQVIHQNPKVFLGFSDTTIVHFMCLKAGLSSFYGPAVMTAFAENAGMHDYTVQGLKTVLFSSDPIGNLPQNTQGWTKEHLDWSEPLNQQTRRTLNAPMRWHFLGRMDKSAKGRLIGGCVESLQCMIGTSLWPELSSWENSILFVETSEEGMEPQGLMRFMRNLAAQGILEKLNGILFSKPGGSHLSADCFPNYDKALLGIFEEYSLPLIPIITRMDFGHSDPLWTLPYGCLTEIDPIKKTITILENGVI